MSLAQSVKNPPVTQETQEIPVLSLDQEDLLEREMATCSSILGNSHGQRSLARYSPKRCKKVRHD